MSVPGSVSHLFPRRWQRAGRAKQTPGKSPHRRHDQRRPIVRRRPGSRAPWPVNHGGAAVIDPLPVHCPSLWWRPGDGRVTARNHEMQRKQFRRRPKALLRQRGDQSGVQILETTMTARETTKADTAHTMRHTIGAWKPRAIAPRLIRGAGRWSPPNVTQSNVQCADDNCAVAHKRLRASRRSDSNPVAAAATTTTACISIQTLLGVGGCESGLHGDTDTRPGASEARRATGTATVCCAPLR